MRDQWIKPLRTAIQVTVALAAAAPLLVPALGPSATAGIGASVVSVAALISRLMAMPEVEKLLGGLGIHSVELHS